MNEILVDVNNDMTRVALLEDGQLMEIYVELPDMQKIVGNIYRGKVCSVLPGMQAAFVDIGYGKNAFLYVEDALSYTDITEDGQEAHVFRKGKKPAIEKLVKKGQEITVQVVKEPIGTKGPRITTHITLPGRYVVLLPNGDYIGVSRRIGREKERSKLKKIAGKLKPEGMGLIVRTAAEGKNANDLKNDLDFLKRLWKSIRIKEQKGMVPRCIYKDLDLIYSTVRDMFTGDIDRFIINNRDKYDKVLELVDIISPGLKNRVAFYDRDCEMFEYYNVETGISRALSRKVWLNCGGYMIIDRTEALTVVDVNTGKYVGKNSLEKTVLKTNLEAADEIALQLRLRDISGIIIIDFIDMDKRDHQKKVIEKLKNALKKDRTKTMVVGMTGLGLIEMTRKKVRQELFSIMRVDCPCCNGTGKVPSPQLITENFWKRINKYMEKSGANAVRIEVHPSIAGVLTNGKENILNIDIDGCSKGKKVLVKASKDLGYDEIRFCEIDSNNLVC